MNSYDLLYNNIKLSNEQFIDRTEIFDMIKDDYMKFNIQESDKNDMFKVYYIYGFGGMGKTYLIKHLKEYFLETISEKMIVHITFEIQESSQMLNSLIKIRKNFNHTCPVFDYALLYYWHLERIEKIDDDFLKLIKNKIFSAYTELGIPFNLNDVPSSVSFSTLLNVINKSHLKINELRIKEIVSCLSQWESKKIYDQLPVFLATDIKVHMEKNNQNYIFIFDSYQQSIPYSESEEWLLHFISTVQRGLYIITSREKSLWSDQTCDISKYHLEVYPKNEVREFLQNCIPSSRTDIIETIIETSGCIPIYVSLAYDLYIKEKNITTDALIEKSKFQDRALLVKHFINHFNEAWQRIILYISAVRVFNREIFESIIRELNIPCSFIDFDEIVQTTLIRYIENSDNLYKLHDVFSSNAASILRANEINRAFAIYVAYISKRDVYKKFILNDLKTTFSLFLNIINIGIDYANKIDWHSNAENLIDLFLILFDTRMTFKLPKPSVDYPSALNDILYFTDAVLYEKRNTNRTIYKLKQIKNPQMFGKHQKSYNILIKYAESLSGKYLPLKEYLTTLDTNFSEDEKSEWYFLKTYIYLGDYYMMEGNFIKAYDSLLKIQDSVSFEIYNTDNIFLAKRCIGHIYRFNYLFLQASNQYEELLKQYDDNPSLKVYLLVNLCETRCFYDPDYVIEKFDEALSFINQFHNLKNKGKLYYSRGIAHTLLKKYNLALDDINTSIAINKTDGYRAGELFAYQAKAFYEYGKNGYITLETTALIDGLIDELNVYEFLKYPIYYINNTIDKLDEINWLDFNSTKEICENFLKKLR